MDTGIMAFRSFELPSGTPTAPALERWEEFKWGSTQSLRPTGDLTTLNVERWGTTQRVLGVLLEQSMNYLTGPFTRPRWRSIEGFEESVMAFVSQNNLWHALDVHSVVQDKLSELGIDAASRVDIREDLEAPWIKTLVLEFCVRDKMYREVLKLWREAFTWVKHLFAGAPAGRFELVFRSAQAMV